MQLFGHEKEEVDYVLRCARKASPEHRVLGGNADGARVQVALSHHHATARNERGRGKPKLVRTDQRRKRHVTPGLELAVDLKAHAGAQPVENENLMRLGQPKLPGRPRVVHR
jgi:hypothetical protein